MSFHQGYTSFSPRSLPFTDVTPLIIPFWKDIDIRCNGSGEIYYRAVNGSGSYTLWQASLLVNNYVYRETRFFPTSIFIATWHQVYPFNCYNAMHQQNTFQVVLNHLSSVLFCIYIYIYMYFELIQSKQFNVYLFMPFWPTCSRLQHFSKDVKSDLTSG